MPVIQWNDFRGGMAEREENTFAPKVGAKNQFASCKEIYINKSYGVKSAPALIAGLDLQKEGFYTDNANFYADSDGVWVATMTSRANQSMVTYTQRGGKIYELFSGNFNAIETKEVEYYNNPTLGVDIDHKKHYIFREKKIFVYNDLYDKRLKEITTKFMKITATVQVGNDILLASENVVYKLDTISDTIAANPVVNTIPLGHKIVYMYFSNDVLSIVTE